MRMYRNGDHGAKLGATRPWKSTTVVTPKTRSFSDTVTRDPRIEGICDGEDPDLFFPTGHSAAFQAQIAKATNICAQCPVRTACREFGLSDEAPEYGILGGLTEVERADLIRASARLRDARKTKESDLPPGIPAVRPVAKADALQVLRAVLEHLHKSGTSTITLKSFPAEFFTVVRGESWLIGELKAMAERGELVRLDAGTGRPGTTEPLTFSFPASPAARVVA